MFFVLLNSKAHYMSYAPHIQKQSHTDGRNIKKSCTSWRGNSSQVLVWDVFHQQHQVSKTFNHCLYVTSAVVATTSRPVMARRKTSGSVAWKWNNGDTMQLRKRLNLDLLKIWLDKKKSTKWWFTMVETIKNSEKTNQSENWCSIYGCIRIPPKHPKMVIFSRKTHSCWVPLF